MALGRKPVGLITLERLVSPYLSIVLRLFRYIVIALGATLKKPGVPMPIYLPRLPIIPSAVRQCQDAEDALPLPEP